MNRLDQDLRRRIAREGPISIAEYMDQALCHPQFGYYMAKDPLGVEGDFITAPEISQMFGELIGAWAVVTWQRMGEPDSFALVELGPGRGTLMSDGLRAARAATGFLEAAHIHLVEASPTLAARQAQALAGHNPTWHQAFEDVPPGATIVIANEFFDALPIEQYVLTKSGWRRRAVGIDADTGELCFVITEETLADMDAPDTDLAIGDIRETSPQSLALMTAIALRIAKQGGRALIIDYGPSQSAAGDSLQAVKGHARHNVLDDPGEADITAHVDFQALATAARTEGLRVSGPITQGEFLKNLGIEARMARLVKGADPAQARDIRSAHLRLTSPTAMGELFKVISVGDGGGDGPAPGFEATS